MKLIVEQIDKNIDKYSDFVDGVILGLKDFSLLNQVSYEIDEIRNISLKFPKLEIFVKIDKNIFNNELDKLKEVLLLLNEIRVAGVFFYDVALVELKKKMHLDNLNLIWSQTHMVTNFKTCDYYYNNGCKYALLSKEITLDEILDINRLSKINVMVEVFSLPNVSYSKRHLVSNYYHDSLINSSSKSLDIVEKVTKSKYRVIEEDSGTGFILDDILNGTSVIKDLYDNNVSYIIFREYGIDNFLEIIEDTRKYLLSSCTLDSYVSKYKGIGNTGFFFKKTIYKVK